MHQRSEILGRREPLVYVQLLSNWLIPVFFLFVSLFPTPALAQDTSCDEVPLTLRIEGVGSTELFTILCGEEVYISLPDLFDFLQIRNSTSDGFTSIEGYLLNQNDFFYIDVDQMELAYRGETIELEERDLKKTSTNFYLKSDIFEEVFQMEISSSIRTMSLSIAPNFELPIIRLARQKKLRENLSHLNTGVIAADTSLSKENPLFLLGVVDWNINLNQRSTAKSYNRFDLGLGGSLLGGDFSSRFHYNNTTKFDHQNQFYRWQYVNNDNAALRQISLGKIGTRSISTLFRPVIGFQLTNAPTYLKKSFGTYELSDYTESDWMVELYINGLLIDFKQADAAGFFSFDVPLMYGSTDIQLRYYGPYGEEQTIERQFNIPFVFMSKSELEYSLSGGMVEDGENTVFANARMNYGLTRSISLGGGVEYLSSLENHPLIPFLNTAVRLPGNTLFSAEYAHNVGLKGNLSYTSPSNLRLELKYAKYEEEQEAVLFTFLEERELLLSTPFTLGKFQGNSRLRIRQNTLRNSSFVNPEWFLSIRAFRVNLNFTTNAFFRENDDPLIYSRLSSSIMLPKQITFTPQLDYEHNSRSLSAVQGQLRKRIFRSGYVRTNYEYNFNFDQFSFGIGLNFNAGFSRFSLSSNTNNRESSFTETASGSLLLGPSLAHSSLSNRTSMDRAHVKFVAFLDINGNGVNDKEEPQLQGIKVTSISGGQKIDADDGAILFREMEPYMEHHFIINTDHLNRIAWRVKDKRLNVYLSPNQVRLVEIPVSILGEVGGYVLNSTGKGLGGIKIQILDEKQELVKQLVSESDGFFSYLGLKSGAYSAQLDQEQLKNLKLESNGPFNFEILNTEEGDFMDNLEFFLSETEGLKAKLQEFAAEADKKPENEEDLQEKETSEAVVDKSAISEEGKDKQSATRPSEENLQNAPVQKKKHVSKEDLVYKVQFLTSKEPFSEGDEIFKGLRHIETEKTLSGYNYLWGKTTLPEEATKLQNELKRSGFKDAYVVHYYNGERISVKEAISIRNGNVPKSQYPPVVVSEEIRQAKDLPSENEQAGLNFKVQIAASEVQLEPTDARFMGLEDVEQYRHEGMYKYTSGNFRFFSEANQYKRALREQGITDAFVVPFQDNKRMDRGQARGYIYFRDSSIKGIGGISLQTIDAVGRLFSTTLSEADGSFITPNLRPGVYTLRLDEEELSRIGMETEQPNMNIRIDEEGHLQNPGIEFFIRAKENKVPASSIGETNDGLVFKVQVLASVPKLPLNDPLLMGLKNVQRYKHDGLFKYTVGESTKLEEIRKVRSDVLRQGFKGAFIVPFLNEVRVNLQEMYGQILLRSGSEKQGLEGINIYIFNKDGKQVANLVSDRDGKISFIGFKPGKYTARLDMGELEKLRLRTENTVLEFEIQRNTEGKIKDPVVFTLGRTAAYIPETEVKSNSTEYRVQLAASNVPLGPNHPSLKGMQNVSMYRHNGMYKYTIGSFHSLREARDLMKKLEASHKFSFFIVGFKEGKRVMVVE